jgi:hypothetical protein
MAPKVDAAKEFLIETKLHRAALDRLLDKRGVAVLKRLYDQGQDQLVAALFQMMRAERKVEPLNIFQLRQLMTKVREAQAKLAADLAANLEPISREAQAEGIRQVDRTITKSERRFVGGIITLPLLEVATFNGLIDKRTDALREANRRAMARSGTNLVARIEEALTVAVAAKEEPVEAITRVQDVLESDWWRSARAVRTSLAAAFNFGHTDAVDMASDGVTDLYKRWTELVDDMTGQPLDSRVGKDSIVLHGQVAKPQNVFTMPPDPRCHPSWWGQTWTQSPNRPNDRSVTMPWRPQWGIPGWEWNGSARVPITASRPHGVQTVGDVTE